MGGRVVSGRNAEQTAEIATQPAGIPPERSDSFLSDQVKRSPSVSRPVALGWLSRGLTPGVDLHISAVL